MIVEKNPGRFLNLIKKMKQIHESSTQIAAIVAQPEIKKMVDHSFSTQIAPSGKKWAKLKPRKIFGKLVPYSKDRKILRGLQEFFIYGFLRKDTVFVSNSKWYTKFHHTGTIKMEDRRFLPFKGEPFRTKKWQNSVGGKILKYIKKFLKKDGVQ